MPLIKNFGSSREQDYRSLSSKRSLGTFFIKRSHLLKHAVDRIKWHIAPKFFYVADFPTHLDIEASVSCQMRCPMCLRNQMPTDLKYGAMDFDLYKKIIDECVQKNVYSIKLSWRGEPLLNPNIAKMVKYAKDAGIKDVAFLTNGERLTPKIAKGLVDAGLDWLSFSIDGTGETYDRIRWPETHAGIVRKVKFLKDYRDSLGLEKPLIRVQSIYGAIKDNPTAYFQLWEKMADKVFVIADQVRWDALDFPRIPNYQCCEPWRRVVVGWNGIIPNCICDYDELNSLGDVRKQSIHEIWHGKKFNTLRKLMRNKKIYENTPCQRCHDPGLMYDKTMCVGPRKINICLYANQSIDVSTMDARPKK